MAVEKMSEALSGVTERAPYTMLLNEMVQGITNPDALAIWAYLQSMPGNWVIRKNQLTEHFNIGRDRYYAAIKVLQSMGLISYQTYRDADGRLAGKRPVIHWTPKLQVSDMTVDRHDGNQHTYKENMATEKDLKSTKEEPPSVKQKTKSKGKLTLAQYASANPDVSWAPEGGKATKHLTDSGVPLDWIAYAFRWFRDRYWDNTETKYINWPAAFANAVVDNWGKLWYFDQKSQSWALTSQGMAYKIKVDGGMGQ